MKAVKRTAEYTIFKRKDDRYAVTSNTTRKPINGDDKVAILQAEGLMVKPEPKPVEEAPADEQASAEE